MKRADIILIAAVIVICLGLFLSGKISQKQGASAIVEIDGEHYGTYGLDEDMEIEIASGNRIAIENGGVRMIQADCPDHLCVHQGRISHSGEMIVCLPNRVTVQICGEQSTEDAPDAIAG